MSVMAVGPALDIDGPLPAPPPFSLISIPGVVVGDGDRWMNGVNVDGYPADTPSLWEPCSTGTYRTKVDGDALPLARFDPIVAYLPITCSASSIGDWRSFSMRAERVLQATISFAVEEALSQGVVGSTNPFFSDVNLDILAGGAAVAPEVGLAYLEDAIGATGRSGIIHATPGTVAAWDDIEQGEVLHTIIGTPIAVGGGYLGADPVAGASAAAGQAWAFASGPVQVRLSEVILVGDDINGTLDTSNNDVTFRAEMYALPVWDTALQAGVLIDWSP
jgi:hypothetical protein